MSAEPQVARSDLRRESGGFSPRPALPPKTDHDFEVELASGQVAQSPERAAEPGDHGPSIDLPAIKPHSNGKSNPAHSSATKEPAVAAAETLLRSEEVSGSDSGSDPAASAVAELPAVPVSEDSSVFPGLPQEPSELDSAAGEADIPHLEDGLDYTEPRIRVGDICVGQIVSVRAEDILVDFGGKTEGILPLAELRDVGRPDPQPGESIEVSVENLGALGDYATLSHLKIYRARVWELIETAYREQATITAKVVGRVKGGLTVDIGLPAFLPGSQADVRPVPDLDTLLGHDIAVRIVKISRSRGNVVVSSRALLEEELKQRRQEAMAKLSEGAIVTGTIKNVTSYGAFVDLDGVDGLLHVTDISWGRVRNPAEVLRAGEQITLKVSKFEPERERVSLSLKHMRPDPWEGLDQRYAPGQRITGSVVSTTDYGAFVELEPGLEGLVHVSELSWSKRLKHPSKALKLGQQIEALITQIEIPQRRISLSIKQLQPDPWLDLGDRYPLGLAVQAKVRNLTSYGAFVELEEGVDGLVHVSDLSWSSQVKHPKEVLRKGQQIKAVVTHVDVENRRVSLGIKQLEPDVWERFFSMHWEGDDVTGCVTRLARFGAFVELAPGVEGLCHNTEMSAKGSPREGALRIGQECGFRIVKLDEFEKKIALSRRAFEIARREASAANGSPAVQPAPDSNQEEMVEAAPDSNEEQIVAAASESV